MKQENSNILTINGGSSSIKFALYNMDENPKEFFSGQIKRIGLGDPEFTVINNITHEKNEIIIDATNFKEAAEVLIKWLQKQKYFDQVNCIGHRVVHGMQHSQPEIIDNDLLEELHKISEYDPDHLPAEIEMIELFKMEFPKLIQVACFDTSFHTTMPPVAKMFAIPRRYYTKGIHRYGFHGLSYAYLMQELENLAGKEASQGKIILAHLGSGASLAAVKEGKSIDTTMGFTPVSGLPMSTRCGDIDPGIAWYLMQFEKLDPKQFNHLINHESGLLGISETSGNIQALIEIEDKDSRAAEAIELFCYQTKKWIGSFAAVLCGLDTLVFSGGIGEHSPEIRSEICDCLEFLGVELDEIKNMRNEAVISKEESRVIVRVIKTNEEIMIARLVSDVLNNSTKK